MPSTPNPGLYTFDPSIPRAEVLAALAAMPSRLRNAVGRASPEALLRSAPGSWSAFQTLGHVRDATFAYAARFRWIIFNDNPFMPDYDENNWVAGSKDTPSDIPDILDQVAESRADLVRVLSRLDEGDWERTGRHEAMGAVVLEHYARHQVVHEAMHLEQIRAALG